MEDFKAETPAIESKIQEEDFDEEAALFAMMTPEEQAQVLAQREKLKNDPSKIIDSAPTLLGVSEQEAGKLIEERFSIARDYMVDGVKSLTTFFRFT